MTERGKELRGTFFARGQNIEYLPEGDRYIFSDGEPRYRFNVIGCGMIGREHMRLTMLEGRGTVHGVYDTNPLSVKSAKHMFARHFEGKKLMEYDTLEAACNDPEVDGLMICTPNYTHIEIAREAVKSGKHILLEKPMAITLQDAHEILRTAREYGAVFQIGLQYRHKAIYAEAIHETLVRRAVGDVKTVRTTEHRIPFLDKVGQWNKFSEYSGGTLVEKCCHYFDLMNLFAGSKPTTVYATGDMAVNFVDFEYGNEKSDIIDNAFVTVLYNNGVRAGFELCMFAPMFYDEVVVCGDEGRLKAYENEDFLATGRPSTHLEVLRGEHGPSRVSTPCYPVDIQQSGHHGSTYYEHKYFIDNIEGKETPTATVDEGFWSVVVGLAAEESLVTGNVVHVDELLEGLDI